MRRQALTVEKATLDDFGIIAPVNIDAQLHNADWTKRTWDLGIDDVEKLREYIAGSSMTVAQFKKLPVYKLNVDKLPWLKDL